MPSSAQAPRAMPATKATIVCARLMAFPRVEPRAAPQDFGRAAGLGLNDAGECAVLTSSCRIFGLRGGLESKRLDRRCYVISFDHERDPSPSSSEALAQSDRDLVLPAQVQGAHERLCDPRPGEEGRHLTPADGLSRTRRAH